MFYVYEHWRLDTNTCFYVGKGKANRAFKLFHRNRIYNEILEYLDLVGSALEVRFVGIDLTETEAHNLEIEKIHHHKQQGNCSANLTSGGEGFANFIRPLGIRLSAETRLKVSEARKGMVFSEIHRARLTAAKIGRKRPPFTEETRRKMRVASAKREALKRQIHGDNVTRTSTTRSGIS